MISELLNQVYLYVNGTSTLQDLETWVLSNLQRILDSGDDEAIELANRIDVDLVQLGESLIDETTILEHLQSYISSKETIVISTTAVVETTRIELGVHHQVPTIPLEASVPV